MKTRIIGLVAVIYILSHVPAGYSQSSGGAGLDSRENEMISEIVQDIDLSEEQDKKMTELRESYVKEAKDMTSKIESKEKELKVELNKLVSDDVKIDQLVKDLTELYKDNLTHKVKGVKEVKAVLTSEQFEFLYEKMKIQKEVYEELLNRGPVNAGQGGMQGGMGMQGPGGMMGQGGMQGGMGMQGPGGMMGQAGMQGGMGMQGPGGMMGQGGMQGGPGGMQGGQGGMQGGPGGMPGQRGPGEQ